MPFEVFQLWSQPDTRSVRLKSIPENWLTPTRYRPEFGMLRSWIKDSGESLPKINWAALAAMVFSTAISGGFWVGIAWVTTHWLRIR